MAGQIILARMGKHEGKRLMKLIKGKFKNGKLTLTARIRNKDEAAKFREGSIGVLVTMRGQRVEAKLLQLAFPKEVKK